MLGHVTIDRRTPARFLYALVTMLSLAGFSCGGGERPEERAHRLVLIVDPTVLRDATPADFERLVGNRLRTAFAELPEATNVDLYFVGLGQAGLPAEFRDSLPFNPYDGTGEEHLTKATAMADSVAKLVTARWAASNERPNDPSSCILTALYRAQDMAKLGAERKEAVSLVVLSDLREACPDFGFNFERQLPDSIGELPVQSDLSAVGRLVLLRVNTSGAVAPRDEPRLFGLWTNVLKRWGVRDGAIEITSEFPETLIAK